MNIDDAQLGAVAAELYAQLQNRKKYSRLCEAVWALRGFEGLMMLRARDLRTSGRSLLKPGALAHVMVLSLRGCTETHAVMRRYRSDGVRIEHYLAPTMTDICDEAWRIGGYAAVHQLYAADMLLRGTSRIAYANPATGELLYVCDVQGAHLIFSEYHATGKHLRHEA